MYCIRTGVVMTLLALLVGCGGGASEDRPATGVASLAITDAAVDDVTGVQLTVHRIALQPNDGARVDYVLDPPTVIDNLLDLQGSNAATLLPPVVLPAGDYAWVRLYIADDYPDSYVSTDLGGDMDLKIPGQQSTGGSDRQRFLQLNGGFTVPAGGRADFTLDVDLRRALTQPSGEDFYFLRPALRLTDNSTTGTLSGTIAATLLTDSDCSHDPVSGAGIAVYLYNGHDADTGDVVVDDNGAPVNSDNPLTTDTASLDPGSPAFLYEIGFVPAGDYTAALTCEAADDDADDDDDIDFLQTANLSISAGALTTLDFE